MEFDKDTKMAVDFAVLSIKTMWDQNMLDPTLKEEYETFEDFIKDNTERILGKALKIIESRSSN